MGHKLQAYTQRQLASSLIGVPAVDRSSQILAAGIGDASVKVAGSVLDFQLKKIQAEDSLAINSANESRDLAKLRIQKFMVDNPDPSTWEAGATNIITEQEQFTSTQNFSLQTSRKEADKQRAFKTQLNTFVGIASSRQTIQNDISASGKNFINISSNPLSTDEEIKAQEDIYQAALERGKSKGVADAIMQETKIQGQEQKIENLKKVAMNFAAIEPGEATKSIKEELAARKNGETLFDEFSELSNSDLEGIKDYAATVENSNDAKSKVAMNSALRDAYSAIRSGAQDIDSMSDEVDVDQNISAEDSNTFSEKTKSYFSTYNSAVNEKIITSDSMLVAMGKIQRGVKRGKIDFDTAFDRYKKLKGVAKVNDADNKKFLNDLFTAEEAATNSIARDQSETLDGREKQLRDAIENQPNLIGGDDADEIMRDLANIAVNKLNDDYGNLETNLFDTTMLDASVDRLILKYTLSPSQQSAAQFAKNFQLSEDLKGEQDALEDLIKLYKETGSTVLAEEAEDEAVSLGIFQKDSDGNLVRTSAGTSGKARSQKKENAIKRILQSLMGGS